MSIYDMIKEIVGLDKPLKGHSFMFGKNTTITATVEHNSIVDVPIIRIIGLNGETATLNEDGKMAPRGNILIYVLPIENPLPRIEDIPKLWENWYNEHKNKPALYAPFEHILVIHNGIYRPDIFLYCDSATVHYCTGGYRKESDVIKYDETLVNKKASIK